MEKADSVKGGLWKEEQEALRRQAHQVHLLVGTGRRAERISRRKFIPRAWMSVSLQEGRESPGLSSFLLTHFFWATSSQFIPVFPGTGHCRWVQIEVRWRTGTCFFQVRFFQGHFSPLCSQPCCSWKTEEPGTKHSCNTNPCCRHCVCWAGLTVAICCILTQQQVMLFMDIKALQLSEGKKSSTYAWPKHDIYKIHICVCVSNLNPKFQTGGQQTRFARAPHCI